MRRLGRNSLNGSTGQINHSTRPSTQTYGIETNSLISKTSKSRKNRDTRQKKDKTTSFRTTKRKTSQANKCKHRDATSRLDLSKRASLNLLIQASNVDNINQRVEEKSGILKLKTAKPTAKTVRPSLRTHQNFEAATLYKTRIDKNAIKAKHSEYMPTLIDSRIEYKTHDKTPTVQWQGIKHIKK